MPDFEVCVGVSHPHKPQNRGTPNQPEHLRKPFILVEFQSFQSQYNHGMSGNGKVSNSKKTAAGELSGRPKWRFFLHPFLITLFPVITQYIVNFEIVPFEKILLSVGISLVALLFVWGLVNRLQRDKDKGALIVSVFFLLFFSYGHILNEMMFFSLKLFGTEKLSSRLNFMTSTSFLAILFAGWIILLGVIIALIHHSKWKFGVVTQFMNVVAIVLLTLSTYQAVRNTIDMQGNLEKVKTIPLDDMLSSGVSGNFKLVAQPPDIYHIIVDGYARSDVMQEIYHYDNSEFIRFLRLKNFYVAEQAHSNYNFTYVSLASLYNMSYLDGLTKYYGPTETSRVPFTELIENNRLTNILKANGYLIVGLPSDVDFLPKIPCDVCLFPSSPIGNFEIGLINATPLRFFLRAMPYEMHRKWVDFQVNELPETASQNTPKYVFTHIVAPHPPFVFQADGSPLNPTWGFTFNDSDDFITFFGADRYVTNYRDQAIYMTGVIQSMLKKILARDPNAIIIIHSDHGPGSQHSSVDPEQTNVDERFSIINAYYFPDGNYSALYPGITPVNSFRVLFNQYLGANLDLLADRSYWINNDLPYNQIDITDRLTSP
jgi:hypothetical protein